MQVKWLRRLKGEVEYTQLIRGKQCFARDADGTIDLEVPPGSKLSSAACDFDREADAVIIVEFKLRFVPPYFDLGGRKRFIDTSPLPEEAWCIFRITEKQ